MKNKKKAAGVAAALVAVGSLITFGWLKNKKNKENKEKEIKK